MKQRLASVSDDQPLVLHGVAEVLGSIADDIPVAALCNGAAAEIGGRALNRKAHASKLWLAKSLTLRELEVIAAVSVGKSNKEVARELGVAEATAKIHLHNVFKKLKISNRTTLAAFAFAHRYELARKIKRSRKHDS